MRGVEREWWGKMKKIKERERKKIVDRVKKRVLKKKDGITLDHKFDIGQWIPHFLQQLNSIKPR